MNKLNDYSTDKIFLRLLNNKSKQNYWNYISELRKRKSKEIFDKSIILIQSKSVQERIIGINILSQFGFPRLHKKKILKKFFNLLKTEKDKYAIKSILYGIGHNNEDLSKKQLEFISSFKNHKSCIIRHSLVFALLTKTENIAIETLIKLTYDRDSKTRDWATFGIGTQIEIDNQEIRKALWKRVEDRDFNTRDEAIAGLAKRKDEKIKKILIEELKQIDQNGSLILESIEDYNDKDFIKLIELQILQNRKNPKVKEKLLLDTLEKLKKSG